MKALLTFLFGSLCLPLAVAKHETWSIVQADRVEIIGQRQSDVRTPPVRIIDAEVVSEIVQLVSEAKGKWKEGWFTAPAGDIRFIFSRHDQYLDAIGVGGQFMVRGGGGHWESKKISPELEARLRAFFEKKPNNPPEPMRAKGPPGSF